MARVRIVTAKDVSWIMNELSIQVVVDELIARDKSPVQASIVAVRKTHSDGQVLIVKSE